MAKSETIDLKGFWQKEECFCEFDDDVDEDCIQKSSISMKIRHMSIEDKMADSSMKRKGNLKIEDLSSFIAEVNENNYHKSEKIIINQLNWSPDMKRSTKIEMPSWGSRIGNDSSFAEKITITKDCKNVEWIEFKSAKSLRTKSRNMRSKKRKINKIKTSASKPRRSKINGLMIGNSSNNIILRNTKSKKCIEKCVEFKNRKRDSTPQRHLYLEKFEEIHLVTMNEIENCEDN